MLKEGGAGDHGLREHRQRWRKFIAASSRAGTWRRTRLSAARVALSNPIRRPGDHGGNHRRRIRPGPPASEGADPGRARRTIEGRSALRCRRRPEEAFGRLAQALSRRASFSETVTLGEGGRFGAAARASQRPRPARRVARRRRPRRGGPDPARPRAVGRGTRIVRARGDWLAARLAVLPPRVLSGRGVGALMACPTSSATSPSGHGAISI